MTGSPHNLKAALGYLALGMHEDAWEELEALPPDARADDAVFELRISIYMGIEKWGPARILAESLAKRSPENVNWWISWAYSLRRETSIPDARAVLLEASKLHPNEGLIPYNLACYSCVEGDILGARGLLAFAFSMDEGLRLTALDDPDLNAIFGAGK